MGKGERRTTLKATVVREEHAGGVSVLLLAGALRWPVSPDLRQHVEALLGRGERTILVDLSGVTAIDAAGVGELVRLRAMAEIANGELWIENAGATTRTLLERACLFELLCLDAMFQHEQCS
jgi:anti-anti-sigma factor